MQGAQTRLTFVRHLGAYAASEAVGKISRLGVVVVVARTMEPAAIGLAAAAMATSEIVKALTENGVGQRIIRADETELDAVCRIAHAIAWAWCLGLAVLQICLAWLFWLSGGDALIAVMVAVLACEYFFMPGGIVPCALAMRRGRMAATAVVGGTQIVIANLITMVLAVIWPSPFAIVLPKLLSAPIWLIGMRRVHPWRRRPGPIAPLKPFVRFGGAILGIEAVNALRIHADKLVIGGLMGTEALGYWFFAVNAGLGIATSFARAFAVALFPHLCASTNRNSAVGHALSLGLLLMAPVIVAQALLAPFYVPVLFGDRWAGIADLVSILCLAAIPGLIWSATGQWLRAGDRAGHELGITATLAFLTVAGAALMAPHGLEAVAWVTLAIAVVFQVGASALLLIPASLPAREV